MSNLIGNAPNQVPTNADLGDLAFQDSAFVTIGNLNIDANLTIGSTAVIPTISGNTSVTGNVTAANVIVGNVRSTGNITTTGNIVLTTGNIVTSGNITTANLIATANAFKDHTDRVSGVTSYGDYITEAGSTIATTKPFKDTVKGYARSLMYVIYQTDGISNTAIMNGALTSLFTGPEMNVYASSIQTYSNTLNASLTTTPNGTSNLTLTQANTLYSGITSMISFMDTRRTHDESFFTNMKTMANDYKAVRQFSDMGESETTLVNNYTGTSKLLTRLNS